MPVIKSINMKQLFALILTLFSLGAFSPVYVQAVGVCSACEQDTVATDCGTGLICMGDTVLDNKLQGLCQKTTGIAICNPLTTEKFTDVVDRILNILFFISIAIAPVMIIVAGFKLLTGGGDPKNVTSARQMLMWTAIGFGIILLSKGLVIILRNVIGF